MKQATLFDTRQPVTKRDAIFSNCRKYRYVLYREWDASKPSLLFVGLNPSTANEHSDDPTARRVIAFAQDWEYGSLYMMNLFAWVTPYPGELLKVIDPIGHNDFMLKIYSSKCSSIVFAWGAFDTGGRDKKVMQMLPGAMCFGLTKAGHPKHPLYLPSNTIPIKFKQ